MTLASSTDPRPAAPPRAVRSWWLLGLAMVVVLGLRLPWAHELVLNPDESMFFVVAQDLASGGTLYVTSWESKGPLLFMILAPVVAVFGSSILALRLFTTAWVLATMAVVWGTSRRLFGPLAGVAAALLYGAFMSTPRYNGHAAMAEVFMLLPAAAAVHLLVRYLADERRVRLLAGCGALAVAAVLVKFAALYTVVIIPLVLLGRQLLDRPADGRQLGREALWGVAGAAAVLVTLVVVFALWGNLDELLFTYRYNAAYLRTVPVAAAWSTLLWFTAWNLTQDPFTMLAVGGAVVVLLRRSLWQARPWLGLLVLGLAGTSFLGVALGRNVFFHYYLAMGLPLALMAGFAVSLLSIDGRELRFVVTLGLALLLAFAWSPYRFLAVERARDASLSASIRDTAAYLRASSEPDDRVFVLGGEPVIYFLADRRAPTRFFVWMHHWDRFRAALETLGVGPAELLPELPRFMVRGPQPERVPELEELLRTRYRVRARFGGYTVLELSSPPLYQPSSTGDS